MLSSIRLVRENYRCLRRDLDRIVRDRWRRYVARNCQATGAAVRQSAQAFHTLHTLNLGCGVSAAKGQLIHGIHAHDLYTELRFAVQAAAPHYNGACRSFCRHESRIVEECQKFFARQFHALHDQGGRLGIPALRWGQPDEPRFDLRRELFCAPARGAARKAGSKMPHGAFSAYA